jgi:hypothetical protein
MKKILIAFVLASWMPYLFLATSVEEVSLSDRSYNCVMTSINEVDLPVSLGAVVYNFFKEDTWENKRIILPYFFRKGKFVTVRCGSKEMSVGYDSYIKLGGRIHIYATLESIKFFGKEIARQETIKMYGSDWEGKTEGETVLTRLVGDKEVKMFGGKVIK